MSTAPPIPPMPIRNPLVTVPPDRAFEVVRRSEALADRTWTFWLQSIADAIADIQSVTQALRNAVAGAAEPNVPMVLGADADIAGIAKLGNALGGLWTLPTADGTPGQALGTNGAGVLSFMDAQPSLMACRLYLSDELTFQDDVYTPIPWNRELYDLGGLHTGSSAHITVPVGGGGVGSVWFVYGQVNFYKTVGGNRSVVIDKNNATGPLGGDATNLDEVYRNRVEKAFGEKNNQIPVSGIFVNVADGDYFQCYGVQNSGTTVDTVSASDTFFGAIRLRAGV